MNVSRSDMPYAALQGPDPQPDRTHIFWVSGWEEGVRVAPGEVTRRVLLLYCPCDAGCIAWVAVAAREWLCCEALQRGNLCALAPSVRRRLADPPSGLGQLRAGPVEAGRGLLVEVADPEAVPVRWVCWLGVCVTALVRGAGDPLHYGA